MLKSPLVTAEFAPLFLVSVSMFFLYEDWYYSPVQVELEPPASRVFGTAVVPVVHEVAQ